MKTAPPTAPAAAPGKDALPARIFALPFGLLLGLALLKFGNPVMMEKYVDSPTNKYEYLFSAWPVAWGYWLLAGVSIAGLVAARWRTDAPRLILVLPAVWLAWQFLAVTQSIDPRISRATVAHFTTCVVCFYLGVFALGRSRKLNWFALGLIAGFALVLASGFQQRFGGLEETRRFFYLYTYPKIQASLSQLPPGYFKKITSNRIWGTLFYPNTLAGAILLLLPFTLAVLWSLREWLTVGARSFLMIAAGAAALACLFWSGSKGGWLIMLVLVLVGGLFLPFSRRLKVILVTVVLVLGLTGFFVKYAGFFQKGATSVVARFDYWRAAVQTTRDRPLFGSGPGTFGTAYEKIKRPESEMARLAHNDYLEQASDSGLVGFLAFTGFVAAALVQTARRAGLGRDWVRLAVWLGVLGWALQSTVEFGLYIPAIAWPAFGMLGWLLAHTPKRIDTPASAR